MNYKIAIVSKNTSFFNLLNKQRRYDQVFSLELVKSKNSLEQLENFGKKISTFIFDSTLDVKDIIEIANYIKNSKRYEFIEIYLAFEDFEKFRVISNLDCLSQAITINMPASPEEIYNKITSSILKKDNRSSEKKGVNDAIFLNVFIDSTIATIKEMAFCGEIEISAPTLLDYKTMATDIAIRGCLEISSPSFCGKFYISFPKSTFLKVCKRVLSDDSQEINAGNEDLVSELCNIVYGKSKLAVSQLNMGLEMVIPTRNKDQRVASSTNVLVVRMNSEFGHFFVKIAPREMVRENFEMKA